MVKKILGMLVSVVFVTIAGIGAYGYTIYNQSTDTLSKTYKSFGDETDVIAATEPLTLLLMGVDTGTGSRVDQWEGNSDSMLLVTVNPKTNKTVMMSLERDILTKIGGDGEAMEAKLNAAYASGGAKLAISTIQDLMNIHVDRYIMINMQGLVQLVDAVGGIDVTNTFDFPISIEEQEPEYTATVNPGKQHINGDQALVYARMRYQDPEGDYGRQRRQREVIQKVVRKVLSLNSVSHYQAILKAVSDNMQTNVQLSSRAIPQLLGYQDAFKHIETHQLKGEDATLPDGGSYQVVTGEHLLEMQNILRESLGLKALTSLQTNAVLYESLYGEAANSSSSTRESSEGTVSLPSDLEPSHIETGVSATLNSPANPPASNTNQEVPVSAAPQSQPAP
ncbi:glycopolymer--peptidoglycan transferase LytR [Streptococcus himalayensis]|uniref:Transporter n=1 Tax=Streptococcus himalayensis TaxID=1888195 RepID=A0A917A6P2_9STRE|nr:LCP family protein [Streptococcus himalayensis]GGE30821.1 transporter [Streptococcus himalayensis]